MVRIITYRVPVLARYARRFLFFEFAGYGLAAGVLVRLGMGWWSFPVTVIGLALLMRCVAVATTFVVAAMLSPAGERLPQSTAGRLRMVAAEIVWTTLTYSVLMPFPRMFSRAESRLSANTAATPVLLLHGYVCNSGIWASMRLFLEAKGVPVYTHDLEPVYAGIDEYVPGLAARIEDICARTGAQRLVLVAHSMGGLAARAYLRAAGPARVAKLITLGTPHHGTRTAPLGLGANARQMEPGSAWLESLDRAESGAAGVPVTSIYSRDDNVVVPAESSALDRARNMKLSSIGHVSLVFSHIVQETVMDEIRAARGIER